MPPSLKSPGTSSASHKPTLDAAIEALLDRMVGEAGARSGRKPKAPRLTWSKIVCLPADH